MFWSDPTLYGATLPYKEANIPVQTPFMGPVLPQWQNVPRFVPPPVYNLNPFFNFHPALPPTPFMQTWIDPVRRFDMPYPRPLEMSYPRPFEMPYSRPFEMSYPRPFDAPYLRPFDVPQFNPYTFYNMARPFVF